MRFAPLVLAGLFALAACGAEPAGSSSPAEAPSPSEASVPPEVAELSPGKVELFEDVLAQHQDLNRRVERVAFQLLRANADLCPATHRSAGFSVHTLSDYPRQIRPLAAHLLGVDEGISVRSVVAEGPAGGADIRSGDAIRAVGDMPILPSSVSDRIWRMAEAREMQATDVELRLLRDGERLDVTVPTVEACDYPVNVVFNDVPNAHTDGSELFITSELVRRTETESRLALVLAHELAHILLHNSDFVPGPDKEFEADAGGLALMARAGYDMETAIDEMESFALQLQMGRTGTHPLHARRVERLRERAAVFAAKLAAGDDLPLD